MFTANQRKRCLENNLAAPVEINRKKKEKKKTPHRADGDWMKLHFQSVFWNKRADVKPSFEETKSPGRFYFLVRTKTQIVIIYV